MTATPLELAVQVFYFFWATLGMSLLLLHMELYFSSKFNIIPRYYLGSLILFTLSPMFFALGSTFKPALTIANTVYVLAFIEFALGVWELNRVVSKRIFIGLIMAVILYAILFEYLRQLGPSFYVERVAITNIPAIAAVSAALWGVIKLNTREKSKQLDVLQIALITLIVFLFIRLNHLLTNGAGGVGSIYQEKENWILWVRIINGALIFFSTLTLHNYFFQKNWQAKELVSTENIKVKELLAERDTLIASLVKANRTAAVGALSASIVHEISQPINASNLNIELLKLKLKSGTIEPEILQEIISALASDNKRITTIIKSLRTIFTERERSFESVHLNEVIDSVLEITRPELIKRNITLEVNQFYDVVLNISSTEMHQVLLNLINNAMDSLVSSKTQKSIIRVTIQSLGDAVQIVIFDNGPGVAASLVPTLFDLLASTKETGMGLGLWLCKYILERHDGSIAYSGADGGAKFTVQLPLS
jgi:signal transduction histidine kinase